MNKHIKKCTVIFSIILILQFLFVSLISVIELKEEQNSAELKVKSIQLQTTFLNNTIREQQRRTLASIRESWFQYVQSNSVSLLKKDINGYLIYKNDKQVISYNPDIMYVEKDNDGNVKIYDSISEKLIGEGLRPVWNNEEVLKLVNIIASPSKLFGNNGGVMIYDAYTGEVIATSLKDSIDNIKEIADQNVVANLMDKKDTDKFSCVTEGDSSIKNVNDFSSYPLGTQKRRFIEKIVLPFETVGVDNESMQIVIASCSYEDQIMKDYNDIIDKQKNIVKSFEISYIRIVALSIVIFLLTIVIAIVYFCMINNPESFRKQ